MAFHNSHSLSANMKWGIFILFFLRFDSLHISDVDI